MKKINDDIVRAFENCVDALSLREISRRTGVGIWQLRKFVTRQSESVREETWDKIYPVLKPYLIGPDGGEEDDLPPRIGEPARKHHDLVDLLSDEKILLDVFAALEPVEKTAQLKAWDALAPEAKPTALGSLSTDENRILGLFQALPETLREPELMKIVETATANVRRKRAELF